MQLLLIRHAESENNAKPVHARVCDPSITARGRLQADCLGKWMSGLAIDQLITSPFLRTLETTRFVLQHAHTAPRRYPIAVWHDVFENGGCYHGHHEKNFRGAEGLGREAIHSFFRDISDQLPDREPPPLTVDSEIQSDGWWGGRDPESPDQMRARSRSVIERFENTFPQRPSHEPRSLSTDPVVVLIAHADFLREMLSLMLAGTVAMESVGPIPNTSVTSLQWSTTGWKLDSLNSVTHLPPRLVTGHQAMLS
ncbi:protein containing Phosphoglycerate mutase domain protein [Rhodopirellula islandica]|uniref:Protein containing Phosphoglycerate mutase domain protein n=1 Tax=Rhodopirellula islandica TaxID=595434 RepID=A0A0J1EE93_RHOIS|nr:histidine phosphatase family protein [Rhodopirellula islandica]KLU03819.1 protein containing Phosphoglycerate mutase domain protein [Rhodopirellula islandica]